MVDAGRVTRRAVLAGAAATVVAVSLRAGDDEPSTSSPSSSSVPDVEDPVAVLGRAYLAEHPADGGLRDLRRAVPALAGAPDRAAARALLPSLAPDVAADFAAGRTVLLAGWLLALTEVRAAAVVSLLDG